MGCAPGLRSARAGAAGRQRIPDMRKYKDIGLKLTPQRIAILDYLDGNRQHPTAEEIYRAVSKRFPTMSFATVYNTLEMLRRKGSISELTIEQGKKRFDPDPSPHHHLMCVICKKVYDIGREFPLPLTEDERRGFEILATHVEFHGVCPDCMALRSRCRDGGAVGPCEGSKELREEVI